MKISVYGMIPYDRSGKVRWLLDEMNVPYENHWLDREKKEHEGEAYLKVNPLGRVPAIRIGEQPMFESGAICSFLADRYLEKGLAPSLDSSERLNYEQWMYFAAATIDPFITRIMIIEDIPAGELLDTKMEVLLSEVKDSIELLDQVLSKKDYLLSHFSAADIGVSYHLYFCQLWPEMKSIMDEHPNVGAYLKRVQERPAAIKSKVFSYEG